MDKRPRNNKNNRRTVLGLMKFVLFFVGRARNSVFFANYSWIYLCWDWILVLCGLPPARRPRLVRPHINRKVWSDVQNKWDDNKNENRHLLEPVVVVVVSHIQRIGCQPEKTTLHGGQSRSWSAEQGKENKRKSLAAYSSHPPHCSLGENK